MYTTAGRAYRLLGRTVQNITKLTRSNITFSQDDQHVVLRLKRSKTDVYDTGVEIIFTTTKRLTCPVSAKSKTLYANNAPLLSLDVLIIILVSNNTALTCNLLGDLYSIPSPFGCAKLLRRGLLPSSALPILFLLSF